MVGDSCWVMGGDEMLWWVIVVGCWVVMKCYGGVIGVGCWLVMKCGCSGIKVGLFVFGVDAPHMLCERPARVVRMVSTSGVEG